MNCFDSEFDSRNCVCHCEAKVIMNMNLQRFFHLLLDFLHKIRYCARRSHAKGVHERQRVHVPLGRNRVYQPPENIKGRSCGVDSEESYWQTVSMSVLCCFY